MSIAIVIGSNDNNGRKIQELLDRYPKQVMEIKAMPKLEPLIFINNQRGVIPPKYYSRKKK